MISRLPHYIVLFGILGISVLGFIIFPWDKIFQVSLVIATGVSYISWGIVHHALHDDLYFEVVVEYAGIAILGSVLAIGLLL